MGVVDRGPRGRSGGVCEYLGLPGAMVDRLGGAWWWKFDGLLAQSLSSAVFAAAIDRSPITRRLLTRARDRRRSWPQNFPERHRPSRVAAAAHHHHPISPLRLSFSRRCLFSSIMSFARTLLRTSRALRQQSSNPIQPALGARGQTQFVNSARSYATAFERTKPHVNIGTIGHVDHGKVRFVLR